MSQTKVYQQKIFKKLLYHLLQKIQFAQITTSCPVSRKANAVNSSSDEDRQSLGSESSLNLSEIDFEDKSTLEVLNDGFIPTREEFVVVDYEGEYWPGQVKTLAANGAYIKCMARSGNLWKWPDKEVCVFLKRF